MNVGCLPQVRKLEQWQRDRDFQRSVPWLMNLFSRGWITFLVRLALLLYGRLPTIFGLTKTAVVGEVLQKNEHTIRRWVDNFVSNGGNFSDSQQGHYVWNNTLMSNEELCERARENVRENAAPRGDPTLLPEPSVSG